MNRMAVCGLALLGLAACAAPAPDRAFSGPLVLAAGGLDVGDTGLEIGFGRTEDSTIASVSKLLKRGPSARGPAPGCSGSFARWDRQDLTLHFRDGDFVGWQARPGAAGLTARADVAANGPYATLQAGRVCERV